MQVWLTSRLTLEVPGFPRAQYNRSCLGWLSQIPTKTCVCFLKRWSDRDYKGFRLEWVWGVWICPPAQSHALLFTLEKKQGQEKSGMWHPFPGHKAIKDWACRSLRLSHQSAAFLRLVKAVCCCCVNREKEVKLACKVKALENIFYTLGSTERKVPTTGAPKVPSAWMFSSLFFWKSRFPFHLEWKPC